MSQLNRRALALGTIEELCKALLTELAAAMDAKISKGLPLASITFDSARVGWGKRYAKSLD